jgi:hypothetical protein
MALVFVKDGAMINHSRRKEPLDFDKVAWERDRLADTKSMNPKIV